jgi:hypothetical protein
MARQCAAATAADWTGMAHNLAMAKNRLFRAQTDPRHFRRLVRLPSVFLGWRIVVHSTLFRFIHS